MLGVVRSGIRNIVQDIMCIQPIPAALGRLTLTCSQLMPWQGRVLEAGASK